MPSAMCLQHETQQGRTLAPSLHSRCFEALLLHGSAIKQITTSQLYQCQPQASQPAYSKATWILHRGRSI